VIKFILIFLLIPQFIFADKHVPYYESLSKTESWLRHYPDRRDFKEQTEKFFLTQKGMPVKVIQEHQSVGTNFIDWYRIELFNGIQGWIFHNQLTSKRTLLVLEDTELFAWSSDDPSSWMTIVKGEIQAPKIIDLLEVKDDMLKVNIKISDRKEIKGWISRDQRIWGDDLREEDFD
jgi:SH3-like domain-containing protein